MITVSVMKELNDWFIFSLSYFVSKRSQTLYLQSTTVEIKNAQESIYRARDKKIVDLVVVTL